LQVDGLGDQLVCYGCGHENGQKTHRHCIGSQMLPRPGYSRTWWQRCMPRRWQESHQFYCVIKINLPLAPFMALVAAPRPAPRSSRSAAL
jgi:hypothetical protein